MSLNACLILLPRVFRSSQCKSVITKNYMLYKNLYLCRLQSTTQNRNEVLVYHGTLTTQLRGVKVFSLMTSLTGIVAQPFIYTQLMSLNNVPLMIVAWSFFGLFTIGTPLLLHLLARKYVTTLKYKPETDTYVATTLNLFNIAKELEFKPADVKVPEVLGMFTSFTAKDKALFVDPRFFSDPKHYGRIMGYDKPLDFKLCKSNISEGKK
ncbi:hypothetical protein PPYR_10052 [Photinus pyralis]|uniref:Transmembrane protein 70 n=1 Tax=Photinus pyralis TaxID=7054 RepID=A0A5N4AFA4_PHOPY|nr:transmembrane protein 70 homolog, mitochondrial [Photinus pyralis]KAB0795991.1 hypothetical protein PPYR_10052 [Photinus pyralis]